MKISFFFLVKTKLKTKKQSVVIVTYNSELDRKATFHLYVAIMLVNPTTSELQRC